MSNFVYSLFGGGLGDTLVYYYHRDADAGYWMDAKQRYPDTYNIVVLCNVNPDTKDLFVGNPFVDEVFWSPVHETVKQFLEPQFPGVRHFPTAFPLGSLIYNTPPLHLEEAERDRARSIMELPYVCVHPFAGASDRQLAPRVDVLEIVRAIVGTGRRAVILGGSSMRWLWGKVSYLKEAIDLTDGLMIVNLVNAASIRLQTHVLLGAEAFVGTYSCFGTLAAARGIRSLVFCAPYVRTWQRSYDNFYSVMLDNQTHMLSLDEWAGCNVESAVVDFLEGRTGRPLPGK